MTIQALDDLERLPAGTTARLIVGPNCRTCGTPRARPIATTDHDRCAHCRAIGRTA